MANEQTDTLILFARDLCGKDADHWNLTYEQVPGDAYLEVAELLQTREFTIPGTFGTKNLKLRTYNVAFVFKINTSTEQNKMVLNFYLNDGLHQYNQTEDLQKYRRDVWNEIKIDHPIEINEHDDPRRQVQFTITKIGNDRCKEKFLVVDAVVMKPAGPSG